jgi:hypothetical protein
MATSTLAAVDIVNQALMMLGDDPLTSAQLTANTVRRAIIANQFYSTVRDATLFEHPWNFATKRTILYAYELPAETLTLAAQTGTGVNFTTGGDVFESADVGREIRAASGAGKATIVTFTGAADIDVDITENFGAASYAADAWRLYYPFPEWGPSRQIAVPSDCLRVWRLDENRDYQVEQGYIVLSQDTLNCRYTRQETDVTTYTFPFVLALSGHLAAVMAEPITGQEKKAVHFSKLYEIRLNRAKTLDAQEGTPEVLESNALIDVR